MAVPAVESLDQLRGQAIAVSAIGDGPYNHGLLALEYSGVDPSDFTWLAIGHSSERLLAMEQGQVLASIFSAAEIPRAEARGLATVLRLEVVAPLPQAGMATTVQKSRATGRKCSARCAPSCERCSTSTTIVAAACRCSSASSA